MNYPEYCMNIIELEDDTCIIVSGEQMYGSKSSHDVICKDMDTIMNVLPDKMVDLIDPDSEIAMIAIIGMIDKEWMDICLKNIKEKAGYLHSEFINAFEKVLCSALLKRFCRC